MSAHHHPHASTARIRTAFFLNLGFTVIEAVGGVLVGSVAIVADAVHDLGDTMSLGAALALERYAHKAPDRQYSYGYRRLSALSALITGAVLLGGSVYIVTQAIQRFAEPREPHGLAMLGIAIFGLAVNGYAAWKLSKGLTQNEQMLKWHLVEDVMGWAAVLVGSILIMIFKWTWIDPALAIGIALFVLWNVTRRLSSTLRLFLQQVPPGIDLNEFRQALLAVEGVLDAHDLHVWSLDGEHHVLSCHIVVPEDAEPASIKRSVRTAIALKGEFHSTIEVELETDICHVDCDPKDSDSKDSAP